MRPASAAGCGIAGSCRDGEDTLDGGQDGRRLPLAQQTSAEEAGKAFGVPKRTVARWVNAVTAADTVAVTDRFGCLPDDEAAALRADLDAWRAQRDARWREQVDQIASADSDRRLIHEAPAPRRVPGDLS
ncbi:MAG TPA: hypothetical protein VK845_15245 [Gemmatimonadales bacterium]|nr:hypothetical protein [Gemmatimonadales bacterium]